MNQSEFKQAWLEALRSGKYEQGFGQLYENGKYCCLGVGAAVANELHIVLEEGYLHHPKKNTVLYYGGPNDCIPTGLMLHLSIANDRKRLTFPEIADIIEEKFLA